MLLHKKYLIVVACLGFSLCVIFMLVSIQKYQSLNFDNIYLNGFDPSIYVLQKNISSVHNIEIRTKMLVAHIDKQYEVINKLHLSLKARSSDGIDYFRYESLFWAIASVFFLLLLRRINKL